MGVRIVIVGKGLAGLVCAWQLVKKSPKRDINIDIICDGSGASPFVHGFNLPLLKDDSVETFKKDTLQSGYNLANPDLVNCLCEDSAFIPEMLTELGIELKKQNGEYKLLKPLGSSFPRVAGSSNHTGLEIINRIQALLKENKNISFIFNSRALRLDVENGKIKGVLIYNKQSKSFNYVTADVVMLASGGFCGIYPFSTNSNDIGGDGIAMAYEAGALLTDMEFVQFEPSVAVYPQGICGKGVITTMFYEGAVLRNGKNERFMKQRKNSDNCECVSKDILAKAIFNEITNGTPTIHGGVYFDATGVGRKKLIDSYASYVKRYEDVGIDISKEPFEIAPGAHTSLGGVVINTNCATNIKGLFAAGEVTGGLHGANRLGGNAGLETLVFGRRSANGICDYIKNIHDKNININEEIKVFLDNQNDLPIMTKDELLHIRQKMQQILKSDLFVVRNCPDLKKSISSLRKMKKHLALHSCQENLYDKIRLENDLICAILLAESSYAREESVGCHIRSDSKNGDTNYNLFIQKDEQGKLNIWRKFK
mgnify:CR=1 FL=1